MVNERLPDPSDPDAVGRAEFATARRGFDQLQVRSYLKVVARELQRLKDRESELVSEVESLREQLTEAQRSTDELDDAALTARLGEELSRVLEAARSGAADKLHHAEEAAAETLAAANAKAEEIVGGAQAKVDAEVDAARARGRELVAEARVVRERMLDDLARRRRTLRTQVEQLRAGRDRLLGSHNAVRAALDEIEHELERELPEAHTAAELTGRRLQHEPAGSASMIETEIDEAKRVGRPLATEADIAEKADDEPAEWVNAGAAHAPHDLTHTDEIPVLDHFEADSEVTHAEIVLSEVGRARREHRDLPHEPVPIIEAPDAVEAVRVVAPDAGAEPVAAEAEVAAAEVAAADEAEPEPVAVEEPAPEPTVAEEPEPEPEPEPTVEEPEPEPVAEPEPAEPPKVEDLFARIRESRAETVARAREVLDQPLDPSVSSSNGGATAAVATAVAETPAPPVAAAEVEAEAEPAGDAAADEHPDTVLLVRRDAAVAELDSVVARKLKRLLADEQNEVQDLVRRQKGQVRQDDVLGTRDHHVGRYMAAVGGQLLAAVSAGATFYDPEGHAADTDLSALDEQLAHELLDPLRALLTRGIDEAGGDEDELLDRVRSAYREVKTQRVDVAARVATLAAFNVGVVTSRSEGDLLRWAVDPVAGCSPDCDDNALAEAVPAGQAFPTGAIYPPNHPGCRCLLVPVDQ